MGNYTSSTAIYEGSTECDAPDREAYLSDIASCIIFQLPYKLEDIQFGYITAFFVIIVILISIFGRIKRHYRWFILNQALFDFLITYDYACDKFGYAKNVNCYFGYDSYLKAGGEVEGFSKEDRNEEVVIIKFFPAFGLPLLTASRFLNVYFPKIFKKFDKTWKLLLCVIVLDVLYIAFMIGIWVVQILDQNAIDECLRWNNIKNDFVFKDITCKKDSTDLTCYYSSTQRFWNCMQRHEFSTIALISYLGNYVTGNRNYSVLIILSILFVFSFKLVKQMKFQATTNKEMLKANIRVIIVLFVQTLFLATVGLFKFLSSTFDVNIFKSDGYALKIPYWLKYIIYEEKNVRAFQEIRVFADAIIVLGFIAGYREDVRDAIKWFCKLPIKILKRN